MLIASGGAICFLPRVDCTVKVGSVQLPPGTVINGNGAGDAFTAGLLVALCYDTLARQCQKAVTENNEFHQAFQTTPRFVKEFRFCNESESKKRRI
jgi:sugar/nucleoside kinase (ribokinase family)